jgi:hypothetical protein
MNQVIHKIVILKKPVFHDLENYSTIKEMSERIKRGKSMPIRLRFILDTLLDTDINPIIYDIIKIGSSKSTKGESDMKKVFTIVVACFFILIGILGLVSSLTSFHISWNFFGAIIPLLLGVFFEVQYFSEKKEAGILVPGGILTVVGILVLLEHLFGEGISEYIWPLYIVAPAIGLFQLYWYGGKQKALLIPVSILTIFCLVSLMITLYKIPPFSFLIPIVLLVIGFYMLWTYLRKEKRS